eukprot:TRINITY_DN58169_c0_g1_i1.p1 TRINITY_DN58169_c0_g1~~TRINITY_DN58169_c0_g1_i1.p1  ORF type:complete len:583 (-),score=-19.86 TRINITY_DN58169_c0_g1_i1:117-1805(-)
MSRKIRYGSRNTNHHHHHHRNNNNSNYDHSHGHSNHSGGHLNSSGNIPSLNPIRNSLQPNNLQLNNSSMNNSSISPRSNPRKGGSKRQQREHRQIGNVGAGGSIYYDPNGESGGGNTQHLNHTNKFNNSSNQLPRIGSSQQNSSGTQGGRRSNANQQKQPNNSLSPMLHDTTSNSNNSNNNNIMPNLKNTNRQSPVHFHSPQPSRANSLRTSNVEIKERRITSGVSTIKGYKPSNPLNWINQDNYFVMESVNSGNTVNNIYCVLDGHGEHGHIVSKRITELLPQFLTSKNCIINSTNNNINYYYDYKKAFISTQNDLNSNTHNIVDASCSGATCVLLNVNLQDGVIIIANCGDSRAIIGSSKRSGNGNNNVAYIATPLSYDHKPDRQDERKRILASNGRVGCRQMAVPNTNRVSVPNASGGSSIPSMISVPVGPCRVWYSYKGDTLGLAMSRSLGDCVVHQCGVSAEPELGVYKINSIEHGTGNNNLNDEFIVMATDGIWDVLDNNTVIQLIVQNFVTPALQSNNGDWNPNDAATFLTKTARAKWEKLSPMIDDITCIVVKL